MGGAIGGIIWLIILISIFRAVFKKGRGMQTPPRPGQPPNAGLNPQGNVNRPRTLGASNPQVYDAKQESLDQQSGKQTFRSVPSSTYGSSSTSSKSAVPISALREPGYANKTLAYSYGQTKASRLAETGVLLEDRKNDWLAKQLREEAAIKRRGSIYDLGASHDVSCEADQIKRAHVLRHNSNGLDRRTFR